MLVTILAVLLVDRLLDPEPSVGRNGGRDQISDGGDNSGGGRAFGIDGLGGVKVAFRDDGDGHCCRHHLLPPLRCPAASPPSTAAALSLNFRLHTMVCIPLPAGVVELGSTDLIFQSSDLTSTVLPTPPTCGYWSLRGASCCFRYDAVRFFLCYGKLQSCHACCQSGFDAMILAA